jgi:hypothetical protein
MKIYNLDGQPVKWNLTGYIVGHKPDYLCSAGHLKARNLLIRKFPFDIILEEIPLPDCGLVLDFFIPSQKLAVEVDGDQHDKYIPFFHKSKGGFAHAQNNDKLKEEWCNINKIKIIHLKQNEENLWTTLI